MSELRGKLSDFQDTVWSAQWVWVGAEVDSDVMLVRKCFVLENRPQKARCSITANTHYKLYINENFVTVGPARCAAHHQSYDVFDIDEFLVCGENIVAVEVHHQKDNVSYGKASRGGFLCQIELTTDGEGWQVISDESWKVISDSSWQNDAPKMSYAHMEVVDRRDMRRAIGNWKSAEYDDRLWAQATVLKREEGWPLPQEDETPRHLVPPWTALVQRDIPHLTFTKKSLESYLQCGNMDDTHNGSEGDWLNLPVIDEIDVGSISEPLPFDLPIAISLPSEVCASYMVFDLDEVHNAYPFLDIEGPKGTVIDIFSVPFLLDGKLVTPLLGSHYIDRIVLSGERDRWEAMYWKPIRYLAVIVRSEGEKNYSDVFIHDIGVRTKAYPFERMANFVTPDFPQLEQLFHASDKTIRTATTDAYTDNYRERRQYAQTAFYASLGNYHLFGDTALQRRYLVQIAQEQLANGLMPAYAPAHGDDYMVILDSNCFWLQGLCQYLIYSGDEDTVLDLLPSAQRSVEFLGSFGNDDGLIDSPPFPYWLDHAVQDRRGANLCLNAHYLGGLEAFIKVLTLLGQNSAVDELKNRADHVRQAIRRDFWHEEVGLFVDAVVDGKQSDRFSEHAQAMVLALGIASDEQRSQVVAKLLLQDDGNLICRESGMTVVTPAMSYFLHAGLCEAGEVDASLEILWRRFKHMLEPEHNGTLWEEWWLNGSGRRGKFNYIQGRSDAQTESAFCPGLFFRYVLGIEPVGIGMKEIVLNYPVSKILDERKGKMPTPQGALSVEWQISETHYGIHLSVPENTVLKVNVNSMDDAVLSEILLNGIAHVEPIVDYLQLRAGTFEIKIPRKSKRM